MSDTDRAFDRITRRRLIRDTGTVAAGITLLGTYGSGSALARPNRRRKTVAVFGGGVAGLTAAHELTERGFEVTVYERRVWGGKCFSSEVRGSATGGRKPLPGEHAYRVPFGYYQNLPDTMTRIPFGSNPRGVFDNLVAAPEILFARIQKRDLAIPFASLDPRPYTPEKVLDLLVGVLIDREIPPDAAAHFANRMAVFFSSCQARRLGQWEAISWREFIAADSYGDDYRKILGAAPQFTQASKSEETAAQYMASFFENMIYSLLGQGVNGPSVRVLNLPTNEAWIYPWLAELRRLGTRLRLRHELTKLEFHDGRIVGAHLRTPRGRRTVVADWYVCALPVERARRLWTKRILRADPTLRRMNRLPIDWMNGISYFLRERSNIAEGHVFLTDSPWLATFIPQAQFWAVDFARTYGDGQVRDKLSAAIADWSTPGIVYGKPARDLTPTQVALDLWEQMKRHVNEAGRPARLTDEMLHSWQIDPGMLRRNDRLISGDPLVLPTKGTARYRPDVTTGIPNLMLCGDYLGGSWIITTMESANHTGRRAANAILERARSWETPAATYDPYLPPEWEPLRRIDEDRYRRGEPNLFDTEMNPAQLTDLLRADDVILARTR